MMHHHLFKYIQYYIIIHKYYKLNELKYISLYLIQNLNQNFKLYIIFNF